MDNQYNLLGVIRTVWKWRKNIIWICGIVAIGSTVICLLLPNYYSSSAIFYAASPNLSFPEPVGMETKETEYYGEEEDMDRILTIAESKEVADYLIEKFNLYENYEINPDQKLGAHKIMKKFQKLYTVKKTKFDAVEVSMEDKDPQLATDIANAAWFKIDEIAQRLIKESQKLELETRKLTVKEKEEKLDLLNDSLAIVRERYGIYNTVTQSEGLAFALQSIEGALATNKAKVKIYGEKGGVRFRDSVMIARANIEGGNRQLELVNAKLDLFNQGMAIVETLTEVQEEASEQLALNREREKQLSATIDSRFSAIYLVESPQVPIFKSRPFRSILILASVFAAFLFSVIGVLMLDGYRSVNWREVLGD